MRVGWLLLSAPLLAQETGPGFEAGFASITEKDLLVHATEIASPQLEGRDSPSEGLTRAGDYIIGRLKAAGVEPGLQVAPSTGTSSATSAGAGSYRLSYTLKHKMPVAEQCLLASQVDGQDELTFVLEEDFVPFPNCPGQGEGKLVFYGFGITESEEKKYDDLKGKNCEGEVVMILEGEPRHKKLFEGPEVTKAADAYTKIKDLEQRGARGILIVRRPPAEQPKGLDGKVVANVPLGFRHTWAHWNPEGYHGPQSSGREGGKIPVLEITEAAASRILGEDVTALAAKIETGGKPIKKERKDVRVSLSSGITDQMVPLDDIVGLVRGSDPALANEYVVLGAHYDHIGVDPYGRIGCGADDNGSGSSGLLEIAEAMALAKPKRSVIVSWFSSEEDGLDGSAAFCENPPVPMSSIVAMLNVDMIGRLAEDEVYVVGTQATPDFEDVLKDAKKLRPTQLKKVFTDKAQDLWERSDHYNFFKKGVPALFFTEGAIDAENPDYHVFTDTVDKLSMTKMARISRFMFNTAWLVANAPKNLPRAQ